MTVGVFVSVELSVIFVIAVSVKFVIADSALKFTILDVIFSANCRIVEAVEFSI